MGRLAPLAGWSAARAAWAASSYPVTVETATRIPPSHVYPGRELTAQWPLRSFLELSALPSAVPYARRHVRRMLRAWGLAALSDDAGLVTSELVTNAVAATGTVDRAAPVWLWLRADTGDALIQVWDSSPQPPVRVDVDGDAEASRGLLLVDAISDRWDWFVPAGTDRKVVWALLKIR